MKSCCDCSGSRLIDNQSERPLGIWSATALVVGSMIGSGMFLLPAALAPYGAVSLIGWGITLCGALLLALTFARLARLWPQTGGPYAYARNAFGEMPGFMIAWSYWISIWCANAAIAVAFAGSIGAIVPAATATPVRSAACAFGALWLCSAINLLGVREAGRMQVLTTALKLVPLLLFGGIAIWLVDGSAYRPLNPGRESLQHAVQATVALTLWALLGLEAATVPAGSVADPDRTIPRATVFGTLLAGIAAILACTAVLGLVPADVLKSSGAPMSDAAGALWGRGAAIGIAAVAAVSSFGALNGWILLSAQVPLAAARDRLFPAAFSRCNARGTPFIGILVSSALATLLVIAYVVSSAAWLRSGSDKGRPVAVLALVYSVYALFGIGAEPLLWGGVLVAAGLPLYFWQRRRR